MLKNNKHVIGLMNDSTNYTGVYHNGAFGVLQKINSVYPYIYYKNSKYYKVTGIRNNQYIETQLEPYYHVEIFSPYDWPLGVQATIDTKIEVWTTQMLSGNQICVGNVYNRDTNGMFNLRTDDWYMYGSNLKFSFGSTDSNTSSSVKSNGATELTYNVGNYNTNQSLFQGATDRVYHITAGNIDGKVRMLYEYRTSSGSNSSRSTVGNNNIVSFYQGTFEESELHLKIIGNNGSTKYNHNYYDYGQAKIYRIRVWHGDKLVGDFRWKFRNNVYDNANIYLWDDVKKREVFPTDDHVDGDMLYQSNMSSIYDLQGDEFWANGYYTKSGTMTIDGVTYEKLVNNKDSSKIIKGISV